MATLHQLLVGHDQTRRRQTLWSFLAGMLFLATFAAYSLEVFTISGGVVFIPGDAALIGIVAAGAVGYSKGGLPVAWLVSFAALFGFRAYHAFLGLSYRSFPEQLVYFLDPEGVVILLVEGLALGLLPFIVGSLVRWGVETAFADMSALDVQ